MTGKLPSNKSIEKGSENKTGRIFYKTIQKDITTWTLIPEKSFIPTGKTIKSILYEKFNKSFENQDVSVTRDPSSKNQFTFLSLISKMLELDPELRITSDEALRSF